VGRRGRSASSRGGTFGRRPRAGVAAAAGAPPPAGFYANEPEGYTAFAEHNFSALPDGLPYDSGTGLSGVYAEFESANVSIVTNATAAPQSPNNAYQIEFPAGLAGNAEPGAHIQGWQDNSPATEKSKVYCSMQILWVGSDWENGKDGIKLFMFGVGVSGGSNECILFVKGDGTNNRNTSFNLQARQQDVVSRNIAQNEDTSKLITVGTWQQYEMVMELNSADGVADGIIKVWIDGTLAINVSDVEFIKGANLSGFTMWTMNCTWNNSGSTPTKAATDYIQVDHLYLSGVNK